MVWNELIFVFFFSLSRCCVYVCVTCCCYLLWLWMEMLIMAASIPPWQCLVLQLRHQWICCAQWQRIGATHRWGGWWWELGFFSFIIDDCPCWKYFRLLDCIVSVITFVSCVLIAMFLIEWENCRSCIKCWNLAYSFLPLSFVKHWKLDQEIFSSFLNIVPRNFAFGYRLNFTFIR